MQSKSLSRKKEIDPGVTDPALKAGAGFPTARYFQIHFEFLQEQLHLTQDAMRAMQIQLQQLQQQCSVKPDHACLSTLEGMSVTLSYQASPKASTTQPRRR